VRAAAEQLIACVEMLRWLGDEGSAEDAAELLPHFPDVLREGEERLRRAQRSALVKVG